MKIESESYRENCFLVLFILGRLLFLEFMFFLIVDKDRIDGRVKFKGRILSFNVWNI